MQSTKRFLISYFRNLPLRLLLLLALFSAALLLFVVVAHEVIWEKEEELDLSILNYLADRIINDRLTAIMEAVTYFASANFLQIAYAALLIIYVVSKNTKRAVEIAAIGLGGFVLNYLMKISFRRIRPPQPLIEPLQNFSFPSGHATSAFIFYGLLAYLIWKSKMPKLFKYISATILVLFSLVIGFSRIYLRLHYPSDVAAGFCIGFAWLLLSIYLFDRVKKKTDVEQQTDEPQIQG